MSTMKPTTFDPRLDAEGPVREVAPGVFTDDPEPSPGLTALASAIRGPEPMTLERLVEEVIKESGARLQDITGWSPRRGIERARALLAPQGRLAIAREMLAGLGGSASIMVHAVSPALLDLASDRQAPRASQNGGVLHVVEASHSPAAEPVALTILYKRPPTQEEIGAWLGGRLAAVQL